MQWPAYQSIELWDNTFIRCAKRRWDLSPSTQERGGGGSRSTTTSTSSCSLVLVFLLLLLLWLWLWLLMQLLVVSQSVCQTMGQHVYRTCKKALRPLAIHTGGGSWVGLLASHPTSSSFVPTTSTPPQLILESSDKRGAVSTPLLPEDSGKSGLGGSTGGVLPSSSMFQKAQPRGVSLREGVGGWVGGWLRGVVRLSK